MPELMAEPSEALVLRLESADGLWTTRDPVTRTGRVPIRPVRDVDQFVHWTRWPRVPPERFSTSPAMIPSCLSVEAGPPNSDPKKPFNRQDAKVAKIPRFCLRNR